MSHRTESRNGYERYPVLRQLDQELQVHHVPEILRFVQGIIPGTKLAPSADVSIDRSTTLRGVPALIGEWNISHFFNPQEEHVWTKNTRGKATIYKNGDFFCTLVEVEEYLDRYDQNQNEIIEKPRGGYSNPNSIFGEVRDGIIDLVRDCQGFGLVRPRDIPSVASNMRQYHEIFGDLLQRWSAWNVIS